MNIRLEFNYDKTWARILACPNTLSGPFHEARVLHC